MTPKNGNYINHIVMVLDRSSSMGPYAADVIKVADEQIKYLARRSTELDQETRVTVYVFSTDVQCVIYDKDVLRLPSLREFYKPYGGTALVDATMTALAELAETPERYGDHAFLMYVLTDGEENSSRKHAYSSLTTKLKGLPDHWTVAVLVPNQNAKFEAKRFGFAPDNIAVWDTTTARGVAEVGEKIRIATDNFMTARATGVRGTKNLFGGTDVVNAAAVQAAGLKPWPLSDYMLTHITRDCPIKEWIEDDCGLKYRLGGAYYQPTRTVRIQPQKQVAVMDCKTNVVYGGQEARTLLGLPDTTVSVRPAANPQYKVFVQSTSTNRKLFAGTDLLIMR